MTNKEFFIKTVAAEKPAFVNVLKAVPKDKLEFRPDGKGRTALSLVLQLADQPGAISMIATTGAIPPSSFVDSSKAKPDLAIAIAIARLEKNFADLLQNLSTVSDEDWENKMGTLSFPGGKWETKRYEMAWGFFFDAIHHRGQLTTYLRAMGAKVPSVYGGSADERPRAS